MRREHNDAAFIAGDHFRREGANGIRRAIQVVVDHVTPVGVFHLQQRLPPLNRGIGDHDIDFAELLLDLIGRCAKRRNVADVAGAPLASAARSLESVSPSRPIPLASQELGINGLLGAFFLSLSGKIVRSRIMRGREVCLLEGVRCQIKLFGYQVMPARIAASPFHSHPMASRLGA
jgi:hypothetical protein